MSKGRSLKSCSRIHFLKVGCYMSSIEILCFCFGCFAFFLNIAYGIYKTWKGEIWRWC